MKGIERIIGRNSTVSLEKDVETLILLKLNLFVTFIHLYSHLIRKQCAIYEATKNYRLRREIQSESY